MTDEPAEGLCMARPGEPCSDPVTHHAKCVPHDDWWCECGHRYDLTREDKPAAPAEGLREAASAIAQPPGAAEMARWMEAWDREPPTLRVPPVVTVKFSRDATPEEVDTVREQIESMFPDLARLRRIEAAASAIALDYHSNAITCDDSHPSVTWGRCTDPKCDALRAALTPEADR